jgi:hypothetical protein
VLSARKFNGRKVFEKNKVGCWNKKIKNNPPTMIFSKTFLPLNLHADNTKLIHRQIENKLDTTEVMAEKQFSNNPLGKWRHLEPK